MTTVAIFDIMVIGILIINYSFMQSKTLTKLKQNKRRARLEQLAVAFIAGMTTVILLSKLIN